MTGQFYILDEHGAPVPAAVEQWGRWIGDHNMTVARDEVKEAIVLTMFTGINHSILGGKPALWETMVFGGPFDLEQRRYTWKIDAMKGHAELVAIVRAAIEVDK